MNFTDEISRYADSHSQEALTLLTQLAQIPAPSHHEEQRVAFITQWLEEQGINRFTVDDAKNIIIELNCADNLPVVVFMAHTDVVFPDLEPLPLKIEEQKIKAPGVGDDTANVVMLLMAVKYIFMHSLLPRKCGVVFAFDSCEEGLGNLKGCRELIRRYSNRISEVYSFDGSVGRVLRRSVGSERFEIEILTEGGHSFNAFGNRNAIVYAAAMIQELIAIKVPLKGKTTYNIGTIRGGTSVNSIAQQVSFTYEFRSDTDGSLANMRKHFNAVIDCYRAKGITVNVKQLGERPCMKNVPQQKQDEIMQNAARVVKKHFGIESDFNLGSTDCNIPLSLGIPSTRLGLIKSQGSHTREEWVEINSLCPGIKTGLDLIISYF